MEITTTFGSTTDHRLTLEPVITDLIYGCGVIEPSQDCGRPAAHRPSVGPHPESRTGQSGSSTDQEDCNPSLAFINHHSLAIIDHHT